MSYTTKQRSLAEYLLKKIGFIDQSNINEYLDYLSSVHGKLESYPSDHHRGGKKWFWSVSTCLELLLKEIEIKKTQSIESKPKPGVISATDFSSFIFCPISFSINHSFKIDHPSDAGTADVGLKMHEELRMIKKRFVSSLKLSDKLSTTDLILQKIRNSKNIFSGHTKTYQSFKNDKIVGVPDYIFQDDNGKYFVVEEKFQRKVDPEKFTYFESYVSSYDNDIYDEVKERKKRWEDYSVSFFNNHIVQVLSYIKNIIEYNIEYGYLIYWYYDYKDDVPYIHKCSIKKIVLENETEELYYRALKGINQFQKEGTMIFDPAHLNMRKCASCVVNKYCGHKTGRFVDIPYPYNLYYSKLYHAEFPHSLKRKKED